MYPELFKIPGLGIGVKSYGFMLMLGFLSAIWFAMRRAERVKANPDLILNTGFVALICGVAGARVFYVVHYWQSDFIYRQNPILEAINITAGGLEYYGGLLCAIAGIMVYLRFFGKFRSPEDDPNAPPRRRPSLRLYLDLLAPAAMWGLAFGRMGCFLNGCCWGGVCVDENGRTTLPWAVTFPYGSSAYVRQWEHRQAHAPAELVCENPKYAGGAYLLPRDLLSMSPESRNGPRRAYEELTDKLKKAKAKAPDSQATRKIEKRAAELKRVLAKHESKLAALRYAQNYPSRVDPTRRTTVSELQDLAARCRTLPVHPAQVYGIINAFLLSYLLSLLFYRRKRHGIVLAVMLILYPITRVLLEAVRVDNPYDTAGMTISQAVSLGTFLLGIGLLLLLYRLPTRSPRAVPFVAPEPKSDEDRDAKSNQ